MIARFKNWIPTLAILVGAPLIAFLLTVFVFQSYQVDGPSMEPSLRHGDRLIVLKLGPTWSKIRGVKYLPKHGEIIVFNSPNIAEGITQKKQLIKRVVALPGERVVIKDNVVTVFSQNQPSGFTPDTMSAYGKGIYSTPGSVDYTVPQGELFVLGDNRANSLDSREFGTIKLESIVGKLGIRVFPFEQVN